MSDGAEKNSIVCKDFILHAGLKNNQAQKKRPFSNLFYNQTEKVPKAYRTFFQQEPCWPCKCMETLVNSCWSFSSHDPFFDALFI